MRSFGIGTTAAWVHAQAQSQLERAVSMSAGPVVAVKLVAMLVFAAAAPVVLTLLAGVAGRVMFDVVRWVSRLVLALIGVVSPASLLCWW